MMLWPNNSVNRTKIGSFLLLIVKSPQEGILHRELAYAISFPSLALCDWFIMR